MTSLKQVLIGTGSADRRKAPDRIAATVMDTLRDEHRNMALLLNALEYQITVFERAGKPDYDVLRGIADYFLEYPNSCHHPKEDVVFRCLRERYRWSAASMGDLPSEHRETYQRARWFHDAVHSLLNETDIARATVVSAARIFLETERRHMNDEEERFFPLAESILASDDWYDIAGELARVCDPLFGNRLEEEFKGLHERLLAWQEEYRHE